MNFKILWSGTIVSGVIAYSALGFLLVDTFIDNNLLNHNQEWQSVEVTFFSLTFGCFITIIISGMLPENLSYKFGKIFTKKCSYCYYYNLECTHRKTLVASSNGEQK